MIKILAVGKQKEKAMRQLTEEYAKRLQAYTKLEILEVADENAPQTLHQAQMEQVKDKEGARLLSHIKDTDKVILLDLAGKMLTSEGLAEKIDQLQTYSGGNIVFVIGGSLGLSQALLHRADFRWKLSDLTFPHQLVRVLLAEQLYRAFTIINHQPYHK